MPRRDPDPGKPKRPSGRPPGAKNKKTIERELIRQRELDAIAAGQVQARVPAKKLGKEILEDFANLYAGIAAFYQPWPASMGKNPHENEQKFRDYSHLAVQASAALAPFQSPKLSAVAIGAAVVNKIEVSGGMPDDFAPPVAAGQVVEFKPGTIVTAEEIDDAGRPPSPGAAVA